MIEINKTIKTHGPSDKFIKTVVQQAVAKLGIKKIDLSIALVGEKAIKGFNRQYRNKNQVTDVLSFDLGLNQGQVDGEIIICYPQAKKQALTKKHSIKQELTILLIHGLLHLAGYDHQTEKDIIKMRYISGRLQKLVVGKY